MSPSKFMVYLSTGSAATALELLRRICQPDSASLPHITARYSNLQVRDEVLDHYLGALVDDLLLTEVGTFDDLIDDEKGLRTVVVKCESEDLEWLSYKPDFPDSIFHFTVYDGPPSTFASTVLAVMREFPWDLRILGSAERVEPYDKERGTARRNGTLSLTPAAQSVLRSLVPDTKSLADLAELTDSERVGLVRLVCEFLHSAPDVESAKFHPLHLETDRVSRYAGQDSPSWPAAIDELTPATASLPDARETAMFLTPPELAFDVAAAATQMMAIKEEVDFGDPAVGPGIFFAALRRVVPFGTIRSATGVEINPSRAHATARRWRRSNLRVVVGDFLTRRPVAQRWNLLLANPPYVRHQEIDRPLGWLREALYQRTGVRLDGRSDIYAYFILSAHDWMAEEGIAAWLIPSEVTSTDFAKAIRAYVTTKVTLRRLHTYDRSSPLFDNARVSSTVIIYQNTIANAADVVQITRGGTLERPSETMHMTIDELRRMPKWTWAALTRPPMGVHTTIADIFDVKRGIATGANSHFLLTDHDVERLNVHRRWIRPVLPKSRTILTNVVTSDDSGVPTNVDRLWLIDTAEPFDVIAAESPEFAEYLKKTHSEIGGRTLVAQRKPFYSQERRPPADFAFIYMAKEDVSGERRFIRNESQAVVLNNYISLTLKQQFLSQIQDGVLTWDEIHKSLRGITSEILSQYGRNYISGLLKLEPTELRSLPLDLPAASTDKLI